MFPVQDINARIEATRAARDRQYRNWVCGWMACVSLTALQGCQSSGESFNDIFVLFLISFLYGICGAVPISLLIVLVVRFVRGPREPGLLPLLAVKLCLALAGSAALALGGATALRWYFPREAARWLLLAPVAAWGLGMAGWISSRGRRPLLIAAALSAGLALTLFVAFAR